MIVAPIVPSLIHCMALQEPAPPMKVNSSRLALSNAALTPTPWSSSWFQMTSILGAAWSRLDAAFSPPSTVKSAATRLSTFWPQALSASLKPFERSCVSGSASMPAISATTASFFPLSTLHA